MNSVVKGLITALVSLFLLAYVSYQAYLALYHPVKTERVYSSTVRVAISANGLAVHNETVITADTGSGVIDFTRKDGERVSKNGVVAKIYPTAQAASSALQLQTVTDKIERLQNAGTSEDTRMLDVSILDGEIGESFMNLAEKSSASNLEELEDARGQLLSLLNRKQLATGAVTDFNAQIAQLQQQSTELAGKAGTNVRPVTSPVAGCFISGVDGYEGIYDISKILNITSSDVDKLQSTKPSPKSGAIGRVVGEYEWYIVCNLGADDARKLKVGEDVSVQFLLSSASEVPVTVAAINKGGDQYAVVLKCEYMTDRLAVLRKQAFQIVTDEITGIKIENRYIHIVNNEKGVFVQDGNTAKFRKIQPVYSGNGYTVSAVDSGDSARLQVYDEVIVNGDGLYDGKIIK